MSELSADNTLGLFTALTEDITKVIQAVVRDRNELSAMRDRLLALPTPTNGKDGKDGEPGVPGTPGLQGERGPQGESIKGDTGFPGKDGPIGPEGKVGPVGPEGHEGKPGKDGQPGTPGRDGTNASLADSFRGPWKMDVVYNRGDTFGFRGGFYLVLVDGVKNELPSHKNQQFPNAIYSCLAAPGAPGTNTTTNTGGGVTKHNDLTDIQGGQANEYYHLTAAQLSPATNPATATTSGYLTSTDWSSFNSKEPAISTASTSSYWRGDKSWQTLDKAAVGLGNVENTALSTWAGSFNLKTIGNVNTQFGVAGLNASAQLPSSLFSTPIGTIAEQSRWVKYASNPVVSPSFAYEENALEEPNVIFEDGVFKMWYSAGWMNQALAYATSSDGLAWTKYGTTPILGQGHGGVSGIVRCTTVIKIDGVYRLYFADANPAANLKYSTSTDGLAWSAPITVVSNSAISGISGWANTAVFRDPSGVWYMLLEGFVTATSSWNIYLLTSLDGSSWSFLNSSNPLSSLQIVAGGMYGGANIPVPYKINGYYHLWYHASTSAPNLPTNIYHAYSSDLINWTVVTPKPALSFSGTGYEIDQVADACVIEALGKTWLFYDADDNVTPKAGICVATIDGSLADVINKSGVVVRQFDRPEFSGAIFGNDKDLSFRDSAGVARRTFLWSTLNNLYYGDVDNSNNSNVFLKAGGTGRFEFYTNGIRNALIENDGSLSCNGYLRTAAPSGSSSHNWKLGENSSGIVLIDIDGAAIGLPSQGSKPNFNRIGVGVAPSYALHIAPASDPAFAVLDRQAIGSYSALVFNTVGASKWLMGMLPSSDIFRIYDYALGDYILSLQPGTGVMEIGGAVKTYAPSGGTAQPWKLGGYTAGIAVQAGKVRVEINGTPYDLLTA